MQDQNNLEHLSQLSRARAPLRSPRANMTYGLDQDLLLAQADLPTQLKLGDQQMHNLDDPAFPIDLKLSSQAYKVGRLPPLNFEQKENNSNLVNMTRKVKQERLASPSRTALQSQINQPQQSYAPNQSVNEDVILKQQQIQEHQKTANMIVSEIKTEYDGSASADKQSNKSARIEIVQWDDSDASFDHNSGSSSVSLQHLMMGTTQGVKNSDRQLTIDNLWKILAQEKNIVQPPPGEMAKQVRAKFEDSDDSQEKKNQPLKQVVETFGRPLFESGSSETQEQFLKGKKPEAALMQLRHIQAIRNDIYASPQETKQGGETRLTDQHKVRFSREVNLTATKNEKPGLCNTPPQDGSNSGFTQRCSTQNATPSSFKVRELLQGGERDHQEHDGQFDFAVNQTDELNMRYKSRTSQKDEGPDAVDSVAQNSFRPAECSFSNSLDQILDNFHKQDEWGLNGHHLGSPQKLIDQAQLHRDSFAASTQASINLHHFPQSQSKVIGLQNSKKASDQNLSIGKALDLFLSEPESDIEKDVSNTKKRRSQSNYKDLNSQNNTRKPPGLREISRQVIRAIRSSEKALTYKEVSDMVTEQNYHSIISEVEQVEKSQQEAVNNKAKINGGVTREISSHQMEQMKVKAIDNYRRRIYDSWSVLQAARIIVRTEEKRLFVYNHDILEKSTAAKVNEQEKDTITAQKLSQLLTMINQVQRRPESIIIQRHQVRKEVDHVAVIKAVAASEQEAADSYERIQTRLAKLKDLSYSNLSLRRLIKRNKKNEERIAKMIGDKASVPPQQHQLLSDKLCNLPFIVAQYTPDPQSIPKSSGSKAAGLMKRANFVKVASKTSINAFDDQELLRFMNLQDEDASPRDMSRNERNFPQKYKKEFFEDASLNSCTTNDQIIDQHLFKLTKRNYKMMNKTKAHQRANLCI